MLRSLTTFGFGVQTSAESLLLHAVLLPCPYFRFWHVMGVRLRWARTKRDTLATLATSLACCQAVRWGPAAAGDKTGGRRGRRYGEGGWGLSSWS